MYTKSKTKIEDQQAAFKKKVLASKPGGDKQPSKNSLSNIPETKPNNDKDKKKVEPEKKNSVVADNKNINNNKVVDSKTAKEKKKRIVYVDEYSDDTEEEIVVVKNKKSRVASVDPKNKNSNNNNMNNLNNNNLNRSIEQDKNMRGNSPQQNNFEKNNINNEVQKAMRTRSQPPIPTFKTKKKVVEEKKPQPKKDQDPYVLVTEFYLGQYKAPICGADIFEMFNWKGQFAHLDINHAYFHWLFPHFQGPHGKTRATLFRQNAVIGQRIIESYRLILDFYGMQLDDESTGQVSRTENYLTRYKETFLRPYTNHEFRIKRMLQFLNVTGYRIYAIQLVKFLENEVFKQSKNSYPPLKSLNVVFQTEWKPYGEVDEKDKKALDLVAQKCLFSYEVLTQELNSHLKTIV